MYNESVETSKTKSFEYAKKMYQEELTKLFIETGYWIEDNCCCCGSSIIFKPELKDNKKPIHFKCIISDDFKINYETYKPYFLLKIQIFFNDELIRNL